MGGLMTGPSVRTPIPVKKLVGGIRGSIIIRVLHARIFVKGTAGKEIHVSSLMGFLSVGFTRLVTGLNRVKMGRVVVVGFVSLLILLTSSVS